MFVRIVPPERMREMSDNKNDAEFIAAFAIAATAAYGWKYGKKKKISRKKANKNKRKMSSNSRKKIGGVDD